MKKSFINYFFTALIILGLNLLSYIFVFLFYEPDTTLNMILDCSSILSFLVTGILVAKFIKYKNLSVIKCITMVYIVILIARLCEIFIFDSAVGITWCSVGSVCTLFNLILKQGEQYLYWWTAIIFSLFQPLSIFGFYKLLK